MQGEVLPCVNEQIAAIRTYFPQSPIIVSTCITPEVSDIHADEVIISNDTGFFYYSQRPNERPNNVNRQIVTTLAGLKACKTKYAVKLRSDFWITGASFLDFFDKFPAVDDKYRVFDKKLLACCYFSRKPVSEMPYPFHPSDLVFFGQTTDLLNLFNVPLMAAEDAVWDTENFNGNRYVPEQHIFINCLRKNGFSVPCDFSRHVTAENTEETERFFANNLVLLTFDQFNLRPTKNTFDMCLEIKSFLTCYTHVDWLKLYQKYVDKAVAVPEDDLEKNKMNRYFQRYKRYRFICNICVMPVRNKAKRRHLRDKLIKFCLNGFRSA